MEQEFIRLIQKNERLIRKVCHIYCRELVDREDLYQDILVQLWKSFPAFEHHSKVSTWLYKVALNTAISRFRKTRRLPELRTIDKQIAMMPEADHSAKEESIQQLYAAIESLNKIEKAIVLLYLDETNYREIAEIVGISESNVGFKINRIKQKLRNTLKDKPL